MQVRFFTCSRRCLGTTLKSYPTPTKTVGGTTDGPSDFARPPGRPLPSRGGGPRVQREREREPSKVHPETHSFAPISAAPSGYAGRKEGIPEPEARGSNLRGRVAWEICWSGVAPRFAVGLVGLQGLQPGLTNYRLGVWSSWQRYEACSCNERWARWEQINSETDAL